MRKQPAALRLWNILHELFLDVYFTIETDDANPDILLVSSNTLDTTKINGDKFSSALITLYADGISLSKNQVEQMILDNSENN